MNKHRHLKNYIIPALIFITLTFTACTNCNNLPDGTIDYVSKVNTLIGSDSEFNLSNGNTYPAIALPWGMNFWTPQTSSMGNGWIYAYDAHKINGFKQTHQASNWLKDYGSFSFMPITGKLKTKEAERASWFSHKAEIAKPHYYRVYLADYDVVTEITPTERAACFRFTFPKSDSSFIILDGFNKGSEVRIIPEERKIIGYSRYNSGSVPENFHNYFVAVFDKDFAKTLTWNGNKEKKNSFYAKGDHVGAVVGFTTERGEQVNVKVASSFISYEQAELNLKREIGDKDFETLKDEARDIWNSELSKIKVEGGTDAQLNTFYSCLYRVLLFPRKFYEFDAQNKMVHYSPYNGKVLPGYMFTDNGFWDTFRATFPFFTLMYPELNSNIMKGLVNAYKESGWLPEWATPGHRNCMIGSNSASVIADSYLKGIRGYDIDILYEALLKNSNGYNKNIPSVGRYGASYYNDLGYVPYDVGIKENAARTLEYAYADFCLYKLASELGRPEKEVNLFKERSQNYKNLFDPEHKLMRGKNADGTFQSPFNPLKWGDAFTEGNSLHYTWSVFQDIEGLINLMGGEKEFVSMLDTVFSMPPDYDCSYYGFTIHEIREMQIANMGNYAHGNQPIQHMIYLYNYAGEPWKAQKHVREVMDKLYLDTPDGYCGDEDNGQTSAWYIFSSMGFYPVCPGSGQYVMGAPLFKKITLQLENGNTFEISAPDNSSSNLYIKSGTLNGKEFDQNWLDHSTIMNGGKLFLEMDNVPNYKRGVNEEDKPFSMSLNINTKE
ncbi:MAG: glycoside hydrolase family 92 protein [Chlorobi bacterium]|nr:glycoside hydrolase family 92 protein [Chlorobiota bacterium]